MLNKINYKAINILIYLIIFAVIYMLLDYLNIFSVARQIFIGLIPFYIGFFLSWLLNPLSEFINKKLKINKTISNIISIFLSIIVLLLFVLVVIPLALFQAADLLNQFPQVGKALTENFINFFNFLGIDFTNIEYPKFIIDSIQSIGTEGVIQYLFSSLEILTTGFKYVLDFLSSIIIVIIQIVFGYIIALYFMGSIKKFVKSIIRLVSKNEKIFEKNKNIISEMSEALFSFIRGVLIISTFVGFLMMIGTAILGLPTPLLFGFISGVTNIIPYLGPVLGGIPIFIVALSINYQTALLVIVLISIVQFAESYLFQPKIMSKNTNLHPVTIIVGMLIFSSIFGFVGFIIATPILSLVNVGIKHSKLKDRIKL